MTVAHSHLEKPNVAVAHLYLSASGLVGIDRMTQTLSLTFDTLMITTCHHLLKALTFSVISFKYHVNETLCWSGTLPLCLIHVKLMHYSTESARNNFEMILNLFFVIHDIRISMKANQKERDIK